MLCMHHPLSAATMQDSVEIVFSDSVVKPVQSGGDKRSLRKPPKAYLCNGKLEKVLADIPFVSDKLAIYEFYKVFVFQWFPVIHISWGYHKVQQLTPLVTYQMQLEAKEPSHGALASLRNALEHLVDMYPLVPAYSKGSAVHETYASTFSEQHLLDE